MFRIIKSDISISIKNKKINVFLLFLLLSFIILLFTKLSKEYTKTIAFKIDKINVPQEDVILNDTIPLSITLKATGYRWLRYYFSNPNVKIDFKKDVYKKDSIFIWNKSRDYLANTQFDKQVELISISPETLIFKYGINMVKKVPVKLNCHIKFSPGYDMSKPFVMQPDSIVVVGPKSVVININYIETQKVSYEDIRNNVSESIKLKFPKNKSNLTFSNDAIILKAEVEKYTEGTLKIPIKIINVPEKIKLKFFPKEVTVSYYVSLNDFNGISAKDFEVICDYNHVINNQFLLAPELVKYPESVKNAKINQQLIEFIILE